MFCALAMRRRVAVALLAEGVDRNRWDYRKASSFYVALLAEGVDRNSSSSMQNAGSAERPSSRGARTEWPPENIQ